MIVVAGVDGSDHTHQVVETALEFAAGGETHCVYVANGTIYPYAVPAGVVVDYAAIEKSQEEAVWQKVGRLPTNAEQVTLQGSPALSLVDYAKNVEADLIVVGSRGRGSFGALLLGSVSHGVVHNSDRNVLIVR
ncbi:MAG TPA: universal stress protein [Acidimicrobiia bacterium]